MIKSIRPMRLTSLALLVIAVSIIGCKDSTKCGACKKKATPDPDPIITTCSDLATVTDSGVTFRDANNNGTLEPYEDYRLTAAERTEDLLDRLSLEEKAGLMVHTELPLNTDGSINETELATLIEDKYVTHFLSTLSGTPAEIASSHNNIQVVAGSVNHGIPVSISSFPRSHYTPEGAPFTTPTGSFSKWPGTLGFAALGLDGNKGISSNVTRSNDTSGLLTFADIVRQEYRAVGIHISFSPQGDTATEPRWGGIYGTFGEEVGVVRDMAAAYVEGFQQGTTGLTTTSVAAVLRNFTGAGPQTGGFDAVNYFGQTQAYPSSRFPNHISPFQYLLKDNNVNPANVMAGYGVPKNGYYEGTAIPETAFSFNSTVLTDILRDSTSGFGFDGVVMTSWGAINDCTDVCANGLTAAQVSAGVDATTYPVGMPWTMESNTTEERAVAAITAGVDQLAGWDDPDIIVDAVNDGSLTESRINESVTRILMQKFELGLFDDVCVDEDAATTTVGSDTFLAEARKIQSESHVLLRNENSLLPLTNYSSLKVYLYNIDETAATDYGFTVVSDLADADVALIRADAPYESSPLFPLSNIHFGQLTYASQGISTPIEMPDGSTVGYGEYTGSEVYEQLLAATNAQIPIILSIYMDRPAVVSNLLGTNSGDIDADVILANFGSSDEAFFDVITGTVKAQGKLPFDLPYSDDAITYGTEDAPFDVMVLVSYQYGSGLSY